MMEISRRTLLKTTAAAVPGLVIGFYLPGKLTRAFAQAGAPPKTYPPNAFIHITPENSVVITINKLEMGQGVYTSMAQLIAEDLDCDWNNVVSQAAPVDPVYNHVFFGMGQITGGSSSLSSSYDQHRHLGAACRAMLIQAAAQKWGVKPETIHTEKGMLIHPQKGKMPYGEVASAANALPIPKDVKLKAPKDFKIIGKSAPRVDASPKAKGLATFGLDVRIPKLNYVMVVRPPVFGATLVKFDAKKAKEVPGVIDAVKFKGGIAVLAKNTWAARRGRDLVEAEWNTAGKDGFTDETLMKDYKEMAKKPSIPVKKDAAGAAKLAAAKNVLNAEYEFPFLAHAPMEPLNCTVNYDGKSAEIWSGHQMPTADRMTASQILGLPPEKIKVNTCYAGGSFGRRGSKVSDYTAEACEIAKVVKKPIKVTWAREDDMRGGFYRPMFLHQAKIATGAKGLPEAWHHVIVGQSIIKGTMMEGMMKGSPVDPLAVEGVEDSAYSIPGFHIDLEMPKLEIPSLWWRSVGHTHTAYVMETLIDELASNAKTDAIAYRRQLLKGKARHLAVLNLLAKKSPWGKAAPKGRAYGLAVHESFNSVVGHVAEVSIEGAKPRVHRVWSAVHCGRVVNPDGARTQVEGAIAYGLSAALYGQIKFDKGRVITGNFNDYQVVRMNEMPKVDVFFVKTEDAPTGLGEPGLPPLAPAVANAVFKLTGKRVRKLPFNLA